MSSPRKLLRSKDGPKFSLPGIHFCRRILTNHMGHHGEELHKEMRQLALIRANLEGSPGTKPKTLTRLDQKSPTPVPKFR
ncbi:hypothetical protein AVEN_72615-1 [Araneus ventricosus]|uniref:Uncharacterized protein n=1 Tax=Araneus ventricosus TaxID=182803 RepID=A0A4Y2RWP4_ARAVE|nr:hypothetical protein AVEN_72615-1 [Araneus ventricosus]